MPRLPFEKKLSRCLPSTKIYPMDWNILGHDWAVELLSEQVISGHIRHAYLFTGPAGVGRQLLALRLVQALNCPNSPQPGQPCLNCSTCTRLERMQHPDLTIVQAEPGTKLLKVEQVREVQHSLALAPYEAKYKIALFINFQDALASVPNALLKTLEEPPPRVIILLIADDPDNLLPTITSRCEVIRLRPLPIEIVAQGLQQHWGLPGEQANLLAHVSGGLPMFARSMTEQPELLERRHHWLQDFCSLLDASRIEKFTFARAARDDKEAMRLEIQTWISFWRDVLLTASGSSVPMVNIDWSDTIIELAEHVDFQQAWMLLSLLERFLGRIEYSNVHLQLALEAMLLDFPQLKVSHYPVTA